jgi:hypothetical protein
LGKSHPELAGTEGGASAARGDELSMRGTGNASLAEGMDQRWTDLPAIGPRPPLERVSSPRQGVSPVVLPWVGSLPSCRDLSPSSPCSILPAQCER